MAKIPHRCSACGTRFSMRRPWWMYVRAPQCGCGSTKFRVDKHRQQRIDHKRQTCHNGMCPYHYPHSKYSPYCMQNPNPPPDIDYSAAALSRGIGR